MRVLNFSAGPSRLPLSVLERAKNEFCDYHGKGFSIVEISHRSSVFNEIIEGAKSKLKSIYGYGDEFSTLFLQGGATLQFAQIPMNIYNDGFAQYVNTGNWTTKAIKEAKIQGIDCQVIASSEESKFDHIPEFSFSDEADYGYICSNNTIYGTQYTTLPSCKCPLVVDSSSDLLSRKIDFSNIGIFYGGVQKNAGIAGLTLVLVRKDLAERVGEKVPLILRYKTQIQANSMSNTPNTFAIYIFDLMLDWINEQGGLDAINKKNIAKANLLYGFIDSTNGFYKGHAKTGSRSLMNVSFNILNPSGKNDENLEKLFVLEAEKEGLIGLKGHRVLGGIRASIYNSITIQEVQTLINFMDDFMKKNG